ncbi:MAG TPA: hypothetical protein VGI23_05370, partial [Steroidobacteraceae bacterium]
MDPSLGRREFVQGAVAGVALALSWATAVAQEPSADQKALIEQMRSLNWVKGPTTVEVQGNSKLTIPQAYVYLDPANTG